MIRAVVVAAGSQPQASDMSRLPADAVHVCGSRVEVVVPIHKAIAQNSRFVGKPVTGDDSKVSRDADVLYYTGGDAVDKAVKAATWRLTDVPASCPRGQVIVLCQYYPTMSRKHIGGPSGPYKEAWNRMGSFRDAHPGIAHKLQLAVVLTHVNPSSAGSAEAKILELNEGLSERHRMRIVTTDEFEALSTDSAAGVGGDSVGASSGVPGSFGAGAGDGFDCDGGGAMVPPSCDDAGTAAAAGAGAVGAHAASTTPRVTPSRAELRAVVREQIARTAAYWLGVARRGPVAIDHVD